MQWCHFIISCIYVLHSGVFDWGFFGTPTTHLSWINKKTTLVNTLTIMCWYFPWVNRWMGQFWLANWHYSCCSSWYSCVLCMINLTVSLSASSLPAGRPLRNLQLDWWSALHPLSSDVNPLGPSPLCTGTVAWRGLLLLDERKMA